MHTFFQRSRQYVVFCMVIALLASNGAFALADSPAVLDGKTIAAVTVEGNRVISSGTILTVVKSKVGQPFNAETVKQDLQAIHDLGSFFDVSVDFNVIPEGVKLVYKVTENPPINNIAVKGNTVISTIELLSLSKLQKGDILNTAALQSTVQAIEKDYHDKGYILAKVMDVSMDLQGVLTLKINEGKLEGLKVKGNEKTKDYVILREMKLMKPGDPFNVKNAKRALQKVYNTGFFEDVNMKLLNGIDPNAVVMQTEVKEQKTGNLSVGGGYSGANGLVGMIGISDNNFRGTGDQVRINWEFGGKTNATNYSFGYTKPWLDDKETSIGFNVYNNTTRRYAYENRVQKAEFDERNHGFDITLGRPFSEYLKGYVTYKDNKSANDYTVSDSQGTYNSTTDTWANGWLNDPTKIRFGTTRSTTLTAVYDSRDNVFNATEGNRVSLSSEFAGGVFGGDFNFNKYTLDTRSYVRAGKSGAQTWAFRFTGGVMTGDVPSYSDQFTVGGADSLRGYQDDEFRGNKMAMATLEYRFPLLKKVQGVAFVDAGDAWAPSQKISLGDIHTSVGAGLRVGTPIGPVRLDYAKGSEGGRFHFSFGGSF